MRDVIAAVATAELSMARLAARTVSTVATAARATLATAAIAVTAFALLTPALLLILLSNALATQPATAKPLHWWPFVASLLAFLVWGLSVPGMIDSDALQAVCAFGALFLSTLLSLVEPIIPPRAT